MTTDTITPATGRVAALRNAGLLRVVLTADAVVTAANGLVYLALGSAIDGRSTYPRRSCTGPALSCCSTRRSSSPPSPCSPLALRRG